MLWHMATIDRKSTRLNSSHLVISYAVFCLKKKQLSSPPHAGWPSASAPASPRWPPTPPPVAVRKPRRACGPTLRRSQRAGRCVFFFNDPATTEIYPLSLRDALPICEPSSRDRDEPIPGGRPADRPRAVGVQSRSEEHTSELQSPCNLVCRLLLE